MLKSLTYNKLKKYQFVSAMVLVFTYLVILTLSQHLPWGVVAVLQSVSLILYSATLALHYYAFQKKAIVTDELSRENERKAAEFTFFATAVFLLGLMLIGFFATVEFVISVDLVFCAFIALLGFKDGYYLYLERKGDSYAGIDNED